ncbi:MAG: MFS transporter [Nanoarchaeota archaeon]|nr:MFS transporter [Nanoarchaeota archaeon]
MNKKEEIELKHKTRRLSIKEGIFWTFRVSFGDHFISPFAIAINSSNVMVALINTLWNLSSATQIFGAKLAKTKSRREIVSNATLVNSLGFLLIALIGFLYLKDIWTQFLPALLFIDLFILLSAGGIGHPAWFSLMGDVVDKKFRGRWYAKRTTITTFMTIVLTIGASLILEAMKESGKAMLGFIIFFGIAAISRFYCSTLLRRHYDPTHKKDKKEINLGKSFRELGKTNFGKFTLFRGIFAIAMGISTPLGAIYLLRILQFDYITYILISLSGMIFSVFTLNFWGKIADKYGNYAVIALTAALIPLSPLWWILSTSKIYLFLIPGLIGGTTWYAFTMVSGNFIYDNTPKEKRPDAISFFNFIVGVGAIIGGLISAAMIKWLNPSWVEPILLIFFIGAILRMIVVWIFIPQFREVQHKQKFKGLKELEHIMFKETRSTLMEDATEIASIKNYIVEK